MKCNKCDDPTVSEYIPCTAGSIQPVNGSCRDSGYYKQRCQESPRLKCKEIHECTACPAGYWKKNSSIFATTCANCSSGMYNDQTNQTSCKRCPLGFFNNLEGMRNVREISCKSCAPGQYAGTQAASSCKSCAPGQYVEAPAASSCKSCSRGQYQRESAKTECKVCSPGQYVDETAATNCQECDSGKFITDSAIATGHDDSDDCVSCPAWFYMPVPGQTACLPCAGADAPEIGATICNDGKCDFGMYRIKTVSGETEKNCTHCPLGQYQLTRGREYDSTADVSECNICPRGWYDGNERPRINCFGCPAGFFGDNQGAQNFNAGCKHCVAGRFSAERRYSFENSSSIPIACNPCEAGRWSSKTKMITEAACKPCGVGKYSSEIGANSEAPCKVCLPGKFNKVAGGNNIAACENCPSGWLQEKRGQGNCLPCLQGKRNNIEGQTNCIKCALGRFSKDVGFNGASCLLASIGKYSSNGVGELSTTDGFRSVNCSNNDNTRFATGCSAMEVCSAGKYGTGMERKNGSAITPTGMCVSCPAGWYSTNGLQECHECVSGKFAKSINSSGCSSCSIGFYGGSERNEMSSCESCPNGWSSKEESSECLACPAGWKSSQGIPCQECRVHFVQPEEGESDCTRCPIGESTENQTGFKKCKTVELDKNVEPPTLISLQSVPIPNANKAVAFNTSVNHSQTLLLTFSVKAKEMKDPYIDKIYIQWASQKQLDGVIKDGQSIRPDTYKELQIKMDDLQAPVDPTSNNGDIVFTYNLGLYSVWIKPLHIRATYVLSSGGEGRRTPLFSSSTVKTDCFDAGSMQRYLRTHPHDDTCLEPFDLLGDDLLGSDKGIKCVNCPAGGSCNTLKGTSMYLSDISHRQGWWRVPWAAMRGDLHDDDDAFVKAPLFFAECPYKEACLGLPPTAFFNDSGWFDTRPTSKQQYIKLKGILRNWTCPAPHPSPQCLQGTEGPLCAICSNTYSRVDGECTKCFPVESRIGLTLLCVIPIVFFMWWLRKNLKKMNSVVRNSFRDLNRLAVILINLAQIASSLPYNIDTAWPNNVIEFLESLDWMNIDLAAITGATCDNAVNFHVRFLVMACCPVVIVCLALITFFNGRRHIKHELSQLSQLNLSDERIQEIEDTYMDLFRIVDVDNSNAIDAKEFIDLLRLVGFKSHDIDQELSLKLIQKITGSVHSHRLELGLFLFEMKSGKIHSDIENLLFGNEEEKEMGKETKNVSGKDIDTKNTSKKDIKNVSKKETTKKKKDNNTKVVPAKKAMSRIFSRKSNKKKKSLIHGDSTESLLLWNRTRKLISYSFSFSMQLLLIFHTPVSRKVFQYFDCRTIGSGTYTKSFLRVDYSIQCSEGGKNVVSYNLFLPVVALVFGGFTLLLPASLTLFLTLKRKQLYEPHILSKMGWMYDRLNRGQEFWEIHELIRKMLLSGIIVFFPPDPAIRSSLALLICIAATCSLFYLMPHRNNVVFWAEVFGFITIMSQLVAAVAFQAQMPEKNNNQVGQALIAAFTICFVAVGICACILSYSLYVNFSDSSHLVQRQIAQMKHKQELGRKKFGALLSNIGQLKEIEKKTTADNVVQAHDKSIAQLESSLEEKKQVASHRLRDRIDKRNRSLKSVGKTLSISTSFHQKENKDRPGGKKSDNELMNRTFDEVESVDKVERMETVERKQEEQKNMGEPVEKVGTVGTVEIVKPVEHVETGEPVPPVEPIESAAGEEVVDTTESNESDEEDLLRDANIVIPENGWAELLDDDTLFDSESDSD